MSDAPRGTGKRPRRTQKERREETRQRLLDVTLECMAELGYAGTTTTMVAERAGLSRGAQLHHFGNKPELVAAALEHLFECRIREFEAAVNSLPEDADITATVFDMLWTIVSGETFHAYMELTIAARTDPELRQLMTTLSARFDKEVDRIFNELFQQTDDSAGFFDLAWTAIFALMEGLAFEKIIRPDDPLIDGVITALKQLAPAGLMPRKRGISTAAQND